MPVATSLFVIAPSRRVTPSDFVGFYHSYSYSGKRDIVELRALAQEHDTIVAIRTWCTDPQVEWLGCLPVDHCASVLEWTLW